MGTGVAQHHDTRELSALALCGQQSSLLSGRPCSFGRPGRPGKARFPLRSKPPVMFAEEANIPLEQKSGASRMRPPCRTCRVRRMQPLPCTLGTDYHPSVTASRCLHCPPFSLFSLLLFAWPSLRGGSTTPSWCETFIQMLDSKLLPQLRGSVAGSAACCAV
jgi:hypothetical protein